MSAKPKQKLTFGGQPVVEELGTPLWETTWGRPFYLVATDELSEVPKLTFAGQDVIRGDRGHGVEWLVRDPDYETIRPLWAVAAENISTRGSDMASAEWLPIEENL